MRPCFSFDNYVFPFLTRSNTEMKSYIAWKLCTEESMKWINSPFWDKTEPEEGWILSLEYNVESFVFWTLLFEWNTYFSEHEQDLICSINFSFRKSLFSLPAFHSRKFNAFYHVFYYLEFHFHCELVYEWSEVGSRRLYITTCHTFLKSNFSAFRTLARLMLA